jgi:UDP-N-acetylglucosamine enolpyruvyl transferase
MTADEARELTNSRATLGGTKTAALEAVRASAEKGLSVASVYVPNPSDVSRLSNVLESMGYETQITFDLVVIKW